MRVSVSSAGSTTSSHVGRASFRAVQAVKSILQSEPELWSIGGCYEICEDSVHLYRGPDLQEEIQGKFLQLGDVVFLLAVEKDSCAPGGVAGLVLPVPSGGSGWLPLERAEAAECSASDPGFASLKRRSSTLSRRRLKDSWEIGARYAVRNVATLRKTPSLASAIVGEAQPGQEVLVLDVGVNDTDTKAPERLRVLVRQSNGGMGWMSPQTAGGDPLLDPSNLHGPAAVEMHRQSLRSLSSSGSRRRWSLCSGPSPRSRSRRRSSTPQARGASVREGTQRPNGPKRSFRLGQPLPWRVGGCYQLLEPVPLRPEPAFSSTESHRLWAGSLVLVKEVRMAESIRQGWSPFAYVEVSEGLQGGREGWISCSAAGDGHDLLDVRDQHEYELLVQKILAQKDSIAQAEAEAEAEAAPSRSLGDDQSAFAPASSNADAEVEAKGEGDQGRGIGFSSFSREASETANDGLPEEKLPLRPMLENQEPKSSLGANAKARVGAKVRWVGLCAAGLLRIIKQPCGGDYQSKVRQ